MTGQGFLKQALSEDQARDILHRGLADARLDGQRVLVVIPDSTRSGPMPLMFRLIHEALSGRVQALERTARYARRTLDLSLKLYKEGLKDFQSVLDAQRSLFDADNQLAQAKGDLATALVKLYQALGGGWRPKRESPPQQGPQVPAGGKSVGT